MIHSLPDVVGVAGTKVPLSPVFLQCNWFQVQAGVVTGTARIGDANISTLRGATIGAAGSQFCPPAGNTDCYDLNQVFVLANAGDTYPVIYNR